MRKMLAVTIQVRAVTRAAVMLLSVLFADEPRSRPRQNRGLDPQNRGGGEEPHETSPTSLSGTIDNESSDGVFRASWLTAIPG